MDNQDDNEKIAVFNEIETDLIKKGLSIYKKDQAKPWGGFFVIKEEEAQKFADSYFDGMPVENLRIAGKLSPKILLVAPNKRLSWQYHFRRAEIWIVVKGRVGVVTSDTDEEKEVQFYDQHDIITLKNKERHRLVGLNQWGIIAEIWQHTDADHPSDEEDIVRVQDDFGR